jgi:hypothetical protein
MVLLYLSGDRKSVWFASQSGAVNEISVPLPRLALISVLLPSLFSVLRLYFRFDFKQLRFPNKGSRFDRSMMGEEIKSMFPVLCDHEKEFYGFNGLVEHVCIIECSK